MTWLASWRARRDAEAIAQRAAFYDAPRSESEAHRLQLERLNTEWRRAVSDVPHLARMLEEQGLPLRFESLDEYVERVPVMRREDFQKAGAALRSRSRPAELTRMTGGSTAEPVQFGSWRSELEWSRLDMWAARRQYGITPASHLFLLWGHSHLLGRGISGWILARQRELADHLLGYHRFSAYDLRPEKLREAARVVLRFRPEYVVGYAVALDLFARANEDAARALGSLGVQAVIATAESFPFPDSADRLSALFRCPVAMEYGAVESGVVAHTWPDRTCRVFWGSHLVDVSSADTGRRLRITSLIPRCTPLVRYEIGDEVDLLADDPSAAVGVLRLGRVRGRCNDYLEVGGARIHSEVISHAMRPCSEVRGFQVAQSAASVRIRYVADAPLTPDREAEIRARLTRAAPALAHTGFERVASLPQTIAGKTRMIVRE